MHCGYVVKIEKLRPHENADRLQIATFFGNDTVVDLRAKVGDIGVYFPSDLQLSEEYCTYNNLVRKKDENGNEIGGYLDPDKRNIKAIKLRGEKSDGMFMPLASFAYCWDLDKEEVPEGCDITIPLGIGDTITVVNGHEICQKYIPRTQNRRGGYSSGNKTRKHRVPYAPLFVEHSDTEQLAYNLGAFKVGDEIELTLKMHGTSQRTGALPVLTGYKKTLLEKIFKKEGTPVYKNSYVTGTRRVVLEDFDGGNSFYGSNEFREQHHNAFVGKLMRGETVYYEVVGFTNTEAPIMGNGNNEKLGKDFVKQYGKETVFSYGCSPDGKKTYYGRDDDGEYEINGECHQSDLYVYRMTITNEDGFTVEYTPDFMRYRCEQIGVKTVPVFGKAIISPDRIHFIEPNGFDHDYMIKDGDIGEALTRLVEDYYDGADPVGKTHIREGVVVRIINRPKFCAYKAKNFSFKVLEGIVKDSATAPDMEEAQEVMEDTSVDVDTQG
jgi:hypothetical protein